MTMNKQEFLTCCGIEVQTLDTWLEQSWLIPDLSASELSFSEIDIARVRLIQDLNIDFGVNDEGIDVILHLVDQLHGLRRALAEFRTEAKGDFASA